MSMISEVGAYLASLGLGLTVGTNLFEGMEPSEPDLAICLYQRPGREPIRTSANTLVVEQPGLQVLGRGNDYETLHSLMASIRTSLQNFSGTLSGVEYLQITAADAIHDLGTDELRRFRLSLNFRVMKRSS